MRGHGSHIWMCVALVLVALALVLSSGSAAFFVLPLLGCMLMMGAMMGAWAAAAAAPTAGGVGPRVRSVSATSIGAGARDRTNPPWRVGYCDLA